jgi:hypothetical protein
MRVAMVDPLQIRATWVPSERVTVRTLGAGEARMMARASSPMNPLVSGTSAICVNPAFGPVRVVELYVPGTALTDSLPSGPIV